jgi:hypothetical protein
VIGPARECLVSALDPDGNELAGVRLPHVAVPLDVSFGWNPEQPRIGVPVEVWNLVGGRIDLPPEEILRRHGTLQSFLDACRRCAEDLVRQRHLLAEDVELVLSDALRRWEEQIPGADALPNAPGS